MGALKDLHFLGDTGPPAESTIAICQLRASRNPTGKKSAKYGLGCTGWLTRRESPISTVSIQEERGISPIDWFFVHTFSNWKPANNVTFIFLVIFCGNIHNN
jgi:hypothetical protein